LPDRRRAQEKEPPTPADGPWFPQRWEIGRTPLDARAQVAMHTYLHAIGTVGSLMTCSYRRINNMITTKATITAAVAIW
jgi:hypothetical protein